MLGIQSAMLVERYATGLAMMMTTKVDVARLRCGAEDRLHSCVVGAVNGSMFRLLRVLRVV